MKKSFILSIALLSASLATFATESAVSGYESHVITYATDDPVADFTAKVDAIGDVEYSEECKARIDAAQEAYDNLSGLQKLKPAVAAAFVKLTAAKTSYSVKETAAKAKVAAFELKVASLLTELEYGEEFKTKLDELQAEYDEMTPAEKALVKDETVSTLKAMQIAYKALEAQAKVKAAAVDAKIALIGTVKYTDQCKKRIDDAKAAYDALNDGQKSLVTKVDALDEAIKAYAELDEAAKDAAKHVSLKYSQAGQGVFTVSVMKGETILNVAPEDGWAIETVTLNGEDALASLTGYILKFDIQADAAVNVTYKWADEENLYTEAESTATGIITTKAGVRAYVEAGKICVEAQGQPVSIYTLNGAKIASKTPALAVAQFAVPAGAYIVKVGNEAIKFVVK